ncbi:hypothetical protein BpHYR1_039996 [Brachionus plicatilis]|uniref:Uncharacterized protein n=1 Tax=Brachionus plicatilis TaxID=10195 RepID=A0A3M7SIC6_BRAPC|nr:hypothetical protein BpHYR1_039996 [Brachionus plicatilis]
MTFADNDWTCKRATENLPGDLYSFNDSTLIEMTDEVHDHSKWEKQKTNYVIREPARINRDEWELSTCSCKIGLRIINNFFISKK